MTEAADFRELCLRCRRPASVCWCDALVPVESRTRVVFIQHPREARVPVSTCRMAHLSLPNSEMHVGLGAAGAPGLEAACSRPGTAVLFPSEEAVDVTELTEAPRTLVVVDGTWSNAKKVVKNCPVLSRLPRIAFTPPAPGNYRIRAEPEAHCVSTIEAVAHVLEHLEAAPGRFTPILKVFDAMVERQLRYIEEHHDARHRVHRLRKGWQPASRTRVDPAQVLRDEASRLVVVFGEANAWPLDDPNRPQPDEAELIQLVAARLATGEIFEAVLAAKRPLSPSVPFHLDLPREVLDAAEPRDAAVERWRRWLRDDDVLVGWGRFCRDLLAVEGVPAKRFVDLRAVLSQLGGRRPGSVEACATQLGVALPHGRGRAARRLTALDATAKATLGGEAARMFPPTPRAGAGG